MAHHQRPIQTVAIETRLPVRRQAFAAGEGACPSLGHECQLLAIRGRGRLNGIQTEVIRAICCSGSALYRDTR